MLQVTEMFQTETAPGFVPWFNSVKHAAVAEAPTAEDAMRLAGQDWKVNERGVYTTNAKGHRMKIEGYKARVRSDNEAVLGIVGQNYKGADNDVLYEFQQAIAAEKGLKYETAGCLAGGKVVWALARLPEDVKIEGDPSSIRPYLFAWNGHDGTRAFGVGLTTVRVRCGNTFEAARTQEGKPRLILRHRANFDARVEEARKVLGLSIDYLARFEKVAADLMAREATVEDAKAFATKLLPASKDAKNPYKTERDRQTLVDIFADTQSETMDGLAFTNYRLLQATTQFVDHSRTYMESKGNSAEDNRALSLLDGQAARMKDRAITLLSA